MAVHRLLPAPRKASLPLWGSFLPCSGMADQARASIPGTCADPALGSEGINKVLSRVAALGLLGSWGAGAAPGRGSESRRP